MNEIIYIPAKCEPFQIKFRDNLKSKNKRFTFFHLIKFFSRIYSIGGKWWATALFLTFQLFLFFPIAIIFDLVVLLITGIFYGSGVVLVFILKKLVQWLGVPVTILLSVITLFILAVIIYFNFSDLVELIKNIFTFKKL